MHHQMDGPSFTSHLKSLGRIFFFLLLTPVCTGQLQTVEATVGDDVILPCLVEPAKDISSYTLEWTRPDLNPRFVHVQRSRYELVEKKHEFFKGRTSMFMSEQKYGNVSLKLSKVKVSDEGTYKCFLPSLNMETFVKLVVASDAASSPVITLAGINRDKGGLEFQCESAGWYPKPEVLWLDGEGKLLSAGPTEITRGPDGLFTVSSRVTVEKSSNNFTCRVQQENVTRTREAHIHVTDNFFRVSTSSDVPIIAGLAVSLSVCILLILAGGFFMRKQRQNISKRRNELIEMAESVPERTDLLGTTSGSKDKTSNDGSSKKQKKKKIKKKESSKKTVEAVMAENKTVQEEKQKLENDLLTSGTTKDELQTTKDELQRTKDELQRTKDELKTTEDELQTTKDELQRTKDELQTTKDELQRTKDELKRTKDELKRTKDELKTTKDELQTTKDDLKMTKDELKTTKDELQTTKDELKTTKDELKTTKDEMEKHEGVKSSWNPFSWGSSSPQTDEEIKKKMKASQSEGGGRQSSSDHSGQQSSSSSDSKTSIPDVTVEVDEQRRFIRLRNESRQVIPLGGRELRVLIHKKKSVYRFDGSVRVVAGGSITLWRPGSASYKLLTNEFVWSDLQYWNPGDQLEINLCDSSSI